MRNSTFNIYIILIQDIQINVLLILIYFLLIMLLRHFAKILNSNINLSQFDKVNKGNKNLSFGNIIFPDLI